MSIRETALEMAKRHVAEQKERIAHQEALIERLRKVGAPIDDAINLLDAMKDFLETMRDDETRLSK